MAKKILIVLTSTDKLKTDATKATGWYLPELAHPYKVFMDKGFVIDVISPEGGKAPLDPGSVTAFENDPVCKWFLADKAAQKLVENTKKPEMVDAGDYSAVFYPGGHGPMFDLADNDKIAQITASVYEKGGVVAAVCHGPVGLVPVKLSNGDYLIKGKKVTSFSNSEEDAVNMSVLMPFMLETKLGERGAIYSKAADWQEYVMEDGRLITGQNPASSTKLAEAVAAKVNQS